ncbi:hypothetical protein E6H13_04225 [Candidatus Bathyarchaeota archaeon]|nr:MAG: hypothetical protein E6H13_04225 [Candidatus Bathyarchaeota archaeon]
MFFRTLARATIRHNRAVLAIWIIALAVSVPAILQVQKVIVYSETAFNSKDSESSIAQQIVNREFNIQEGSSGVVVISHNDVRGNETRDFTLALNWTLRNDPTLTNIGNITTIYDIYYQLLLGFTSVAHFQLYQIQNATNLANLLEFGIPNTYLTSWTSIVNNAGFNVTGSQVIAYNRIANATSWAIVSPLIPPTYAQVAIDYQNLFYKSWNSTFSPAENYNTFQLLSNYSPLQRAQNVTKGYPGMTGQPPYYNVTYSYFESLPFDPQTKGLFLSTIQVFNMYPICSTCNNWNSLPAVRNFSISTFESQANLTTTQQNLIGPIYDLGPSSSQPEFSSLATQLLHAGNIHSYPVQPSRAVSDQFISRDSRTMLVIIDFKPQGGDPSSSTQQVRDDVIVAAKISGQTLSAYVTGAPAFNYDVEIQSAADVERIDPVTVALILIIVGLFFSSLFVPMLPVSAIGLSVGVAFGLVYVIGTLITSVHFLVLTLLPVSMFGAGSDYCIFLVSRYAEERKAGRGKNDSVERAVVRAGESIATSGATVVIAFGSLAVAGFGMLRSIGLAVMLGISIALIVCLTLVPATLSLLGDKLFWPRGLRVKPPRSGSKSYYHRAAKFTAKHSKMVLLVALAASLPATGAVLYSKTSHDLISQIPDDLGSKQGYIEMTNGFGAGTITPTFTVVETPVQLISGSTINVTALRNISALENSTLAVPGVSRVYGATHPSGEAIPYSSFPKLNTAEQQQMFDSMKPFLGSSGKSAIVFAVLSSEPYSDNSIETISKIRGVVNILQSQNPFLSTSTVLVGGETASIADLSVSSASDYLEMATLVLVGVFIILLVALRSVLTPIRLIFTILLSVSWALAAVVYISQLFFGSSIIWMLPIMLLVIMIGLGLDYDIFLVTRIREYFTEGSSDDAAIENAVEHTGPIITTSGLVTAGAFATMMLSRIPLLQQLGMGIFIVVMLDAGLVRIYLVPSIMRYMKRLNWWAPRIFRRVPARNPLLTQPQATFDREAKEI